MYMRLAIEYCWDTVLGKGGVEDVGLDVELDVEFDVELDTWVGVMGAVGAVGARKLGSYARMASIIACRVMRLARLIPNSRITSASSPCVILASESCAQLPVE